MPAKKKTHKTKDGRTARKGLYYYISVKPDRVVRMRDKPKGMKNATRNDKRVTGSAAKPKKKSKKN